MFTPLCLLSYSYIQLYNSKLYRFIKWCSHRCKILLQKTTYIYRSSRNSLAELKRCHKSPAACITQYTTIILQVPPIPSAFITQYHRQPRPSSSPALCTMKRQEPKVLYQISSRQITFHTLFRWYSLIESLLSKSCTFYCNSNTHTLNSLVYYILILKRQCGQKGVYSCLRM